MIRIKNKAEYHIILTKAGSAAVANDIANFCVPAAGYIKAIVATYGLIGTDGTGAPTQDVQLDVKKNGTSIFASAATSILWTHALQVGGANTPKNADSVGVPSVNPTAVAKGDKIRLDVLQILNGTTPTQPLDLSVTIVLTRGAYPSAPQGMLQNVFSELDA